MNSTDFYRIKLQQADEIQKWFPLIPHPRLLLHWQMHYPKDIVRIATISGHRLGLMKEAGLMEEEEKRIRELRMTGHSIPDKDYHSFCKKSGGCDKVNKYMKETLRFLLVRTLQNKLEEGQMFIELTDE